MKRFFIRVLVLLLISSPVVFAWQNKTFLWTPPTQNTDGSPLPDNLIASYNIFCKETAQATATLLGTVTNTGGTNQWTSPNGSLPPGTYDCFATTVRVDSVESEASNTVNFSVPQTTPGQPEGFSVTIP